MNKDLNAVLGSDAYWQVNKKLARHFNCNNTALLLSDLISKENYFRSRNELLEGGWFYNTGEKIEEDTNLTPYQQRKSLKILKKHNFVDTKLQGLPAKLHFKILHNLVLDFLTTSCEKTSQLDEQFLYTNNNIKNNNKENKNKTIKDGFEKIKADKAQISVDAAEGKKEARKKVAEKKEDTSYMKMMEIYYEWFKSRNGDIPPKIDGIEGKALKSIIKYLDSIGRSKNNHATPEELHESTCEMFFYILKKWETLEPFLQKQVKIAQINSNITNIINYIKNGAKTKTAQEQKRDRTGVIADSFASIDDYYNK